MTLPNLMSPENRRNPYPLYAELRSSRPVSQVDPFGLWAVSRYDDAVAVLKDPQRFTSTERLRMRPQWLEGSRTTRGLIMMDPPEHTKLRSLVSRAFTPAALARLEARIRARADALAGEALEKRRVDFVADFALRLPAFVIGEMLGFDPSLHARFKEWADDIASIGAPQHTPEQRERIIRTLADLHRYLDEVIAARRQHPADDMISDLLRAEVDGRGLTHDELVGFGGLLLIAGLETTVNLLSNTLLCLSRFPEVLPRVRGDLGLVPRLVEEVLRFEPPVQLVLRGATADVELSGVRIPAGAMVAVLLASACRDERYFERPEEFVLAREKTVNLPFGHGIHFCLGAPLARLEAKLALEALLPRLRAFQLGGEEVRWTNALTVRGPLELPVELVPA